MKRTKTKVNFLITTISGQEVAGSIFFDGKRMMAKGIGKDILKEARRIGIRDFNGEVFYPKDGMKFMHRLKYVYSGSYLRATEIQKM